MCVCRRDPFVRKDFENFGGTRLINFEASYSFRGGEALSPLSFLFNKIFDSYTSLENFSRRFRVTETVIWEKLSYLDDEIKKKKKKFRRFIYFCFAFDRKHRCIIPSSVHPREANDSRATDIINHAAYCAPRCLNGHCWVGRIYSIL